MRFPIRSALATVLVAAAAGAQIPQLTTVVPDLDSGSLDNPGTWTARAFAGELEVAGALWMRVHFSASRTDLPPGSRLRVTGTDPGAWQVFDARSLDDYRHGSAVFNGSRVEVELFAAPGTRGNRVAVDRIEYGLQSFFAEDSICPPGDDRQLSDEPRIARSYPGSCTMWLAGEHTLVTAGHCAGWELPGIGPIASLALFEVPLSDADGQPRFPPPEHQYPLDLATLQRQDNGPGLDWAVVSSRRNSNHLAYAGGRQGWYGIGAVPEIAGEQIRVTGYGAGGTVSPTWSWAQKTDLGAGIEATAAEIRYHTDTSTGNSGSPIILERTGEVIGIHTDGGCGGFPGWNRGTRIDLPALQAALEAVSGSRVVGRLGTWGQGCAGGQGTPTLVLGGVPDVGGTVTVSVAWAPAGLGVVAVGFSDTSFGEQPLPLALDAYGLEGCTLYSSIDQQLPVSTGLGLPRVEIPIPVDPALIDVEAFVQFLGLDPGAPNNLGAVASNAGRIRVGN